MGLAVTERDGSISGLVSKPGKSLNSVYCFIELFCLSVCLRKRSHIIVQAGLELTLQLRLILTSSNLPIYSQELLVRLLPRIVVKVGF